MIRLIADENIPRPIILKLRQLGYDLIAVRETRPRIPDEEVLAASVELSAVLLTEDKDFGDLVFVEQQEITGVVLLRLHGLTPGEKAELVAATLDFHGDQLVGAFTLVSQTQVRIRPRTA